MSPISLQPDKVKLITLACCALHNYLRKNAPSTLTVSDTQPELCNLPSLPPEALRPSSAALHVRDLFCDYFNGVGNVSFQHEAIADSS